MFGMTSGGRSTGNGGIFGILSSIPASVVGFCEQHHLRAYENVVAEILRRHLDLFVLEAFIIDGL